MEVELSKYSVIEGDVCGGRVFLIFCYRRRRLVELSKYSVIEGDVCGGRVI